MLKVRMMLGYRLLKSNTHTLRCRPVTGSSTCPPCCAANTRESPERTVGATMFRRRSSVRYRKSNEAMLAATRSGIIPVKRVRANASGMRFSRATIS